MKNKQIPNFIFDMMPYFVPIFHGNPHLTEIPISTCNSNPGEPSNGLVQGSPLMVGWLEYDPFREGEFFHVESWLKNENKFFRGYLGGK